MSSAHLTSTSFQLGHEHSLYDNLKQRELRSSIPLRFMSLADIRPIKKKRKNVPHVQAHRHILPLFLCSSHCFTRKKSTRRDSKTNPVSKANKYKEKSALSAVCLQSGYNSNDNLKFSFTVSIIF